MANVYLGLGSNMGDRQANIGAALKGLAKLPGTRLTARAGLYETAPVGGPPGQADFYNTACVVDTELSPREFHAHTQALEREIGRDRAREEVVWGPRVIDIDILLWDDLTLAAKDLLIPHPRLSQRAFALLPLAELAPDLLHPFECLTIRQLVERLGDTNAGIRRLSL